MPMKSRPTKAPVAEKYECKRIFGVDVIFEGAVDKSETFDTYNEARKFADAESKDLRGDSDAMKHEWEVVLTTMYECDDPKGIGWIEGSQWADEIPETIDENRSGA